jgi:hypothetical protein
MGRAVRTVIVVLLLVLAGCAGFGGQTSDPSPSPETTTAISTERATTTTETTSPTIARSDVVEYNDLSAEGQRFAEPLVENGSLTAPPPSLPEPFSTSDEPRYLRYDGALYRLSWDKLGLVADYSIRNVQPENASEITAGTTVVAYRNLSTRARTVFERALAGERESYWPEEFPDVFHPPRPPVVKYDGTHYSLIVVTGDRWQYDVTAERVEGRSGAPVLGRPIPRESGVTVSRKRPTRREYRLVRSSRPMREGRRPCTVANA